MNTTNSGLHRKLAALASAILVLPALRSNAGDYKPARKEGPGEVVQMSRCLAVPAHPFDVVLGRPTRDSVTASVLVYQDAEGCIAYGAERGNYQHQTPKRLFNKGEPAEVVIGSLRPDTQYFYQEVPQPGNPGSNRVPRSAAEYGYQSGTILGGSGHLRVKLAPEQAAVEYRCASEIGLRRADAYVIKVGRSQ